MSQDSKYKELEQRAFLAYHQDGLIDMIIGMCILGFGLNMATDSSAFSILSWIPILFYLPLKNRVTAPRFGYVRFSSERSATTKWLIGILVVGLALLFGLGVFVFAVAESIPPEVATWLRQYHMLIFSIVGAVILLCAAVWTGMRRFTVYAGLSVLIVATGSYLGVHPAVYVIILGALILAVGLWMLAGFVRKYPIVTEEDGDDVQ